MGRRLKRRRVVLGCALGLLMGMSGLALPANADIATKNQPKTAALLFVLQGTGGTYADNGNGTATLTLTGVNGLATWFNDRPQRQAGTAAIPDSLKMIGFAKDPPNAVMTVSLADPKHDALAVKLETPSYDQANATLTFTATPLKKPPGAGLSGYRSQLDHSVDPSFGEFSLFVDDTNTRVTPEGAPNAPGGGLDCDPSKPDTFWGQCRPVNLDVTLSRPYRSRYRLTYLAGPNCTTFERGTGEVGDLAEEVMPPYRVEPPFHLVQNRLFWARSDGGCGFQRSNAWYRVETTKCTEPPRPCTVFDGPSRLINITEINVVEALYTVECGPGTLPCAGQIGPKDAHSIPTAIVKLG
jgi:hypothetical protein